MATKLNMVEIPDMADIEDDETLPEGLSPEERARLMSERQQSKQDRMDKWNNQCIAEACVVRREVASLMQVNELFHSYVEGGMDKETAIDAAIAETGARVTEATRAALIKAF